ncbi:hypothetical protein ONS95_009154 [Cadophora gregata]|uniref:uncharacterized protein n=1 Tax=Cadophora gregata TaxID=51156 RepID=UPI0026DBF68C|nr:uncharacterized protein ONS95_009154 [Cadophora gregata]KAK0124172.1 hypothetical protein ONS95_009154 [Cadophora gregata]KAK0130504.1 hypothetical protein ONS96_001021 [Cadophora gregata f. sp. sojae]
MASKFELPRKSFEDDTSNDRLLQDEPNGFPDKQHHMSEFRRTLLKYAFISSTTLTILLLSITTSTLLLQKLHFTPNSSRATTPQISPGNILNCGTSPSQARALNCIFDIMDYSWTPKPCFHASLSQYYLDLALSRNLTFHLTSSQSKTLPTSEVLAGKHEYVFTTRIFHTLHCAYFLNRQTSVLMDGLATSLMRNASYGVHCLNEVMEPGNAEEEIFAGFHYERCAMGLGYLEPSARRRPKGKGLGKVVDGGAGNALKLPDPPAV